MPALLADAVVIVHLLFIVFAVAGGLLVLRRTWVAWVHVPAALRPYVGRDLLEART